MPDLSSIKECHKPLREQIVVVAEFYAHKIRPERISYRTGIDINLVTNLVNGEYEPQLFQYLLKRSRVERRNQRLKAAMKKNGAVRRSLQQKIDADFEETNK